MTDDQNKPPFVTVKAKATDNKVILFETHPDHVTDDNPTGEIFLVADGTVHTVRRTPEVEKRLQSGALVETSEPAASGRGAIGDIKRMFTESDEQRIAREQAEAERKATAERQASTSSADQQGMMSSGQQVSRAPRKGLS